MFNKKVVNDFRIIDLHSVFVTNIISNKRVNMDEYLKQFDLPEEYQKFVLAINPGFDSRFYDEIQLGCCNNNYFFELLSNHPFDMASMPKDIQLVLESSTFGKYLFIRPEKTLKLESKDVLLFYKEIIENGYFNEYAKMIYGLFTNAYDKSRPKVNDELNKIRKIEVNK